MAAGPVDYSLLVGPVLLGVALNIYLYGIVCVQFISYTEHKFQDSRATKLMVLGLFVIDTSHTAVCIFAAWDLCVTNYANPSILGFSNWTIPFTAIATVLAAFTTQLFLGQRVVRLAKKKLLGVVILLFSLSSLIFGFLVAVQVGRAHAIANFPKFHVQLTVTGWLVSQTAADVVITGSLLWYLSSVRTGFKRTDRIIQRLMRGAVQTGLFATLFAMGDLLSFLLLGTSNLYVFFVFPLGRIYTNTLLETLNNRPSLKASAGSIIDMDSSQHAARGFRSDAHHPHSQAGTANGGVHAIHIRTEITTDAYEVDSKGQTDRRDPETGSNDNIYPPAK